MTKIADIVTPQLILIGFGALILYAVFTYIAGLNTKGRIGNLPVRASPLMTRMERQTIAFVERTLPNSRVHAQVSMGAIMKPQSGLSRLERTTTFNRFSSRRVDFVVEDRATGKIILLIELDDKTHNLQADKDRDRLTRSAGYITVRLPASQKPTEMNVRRHILAALPPRLVPQPTAIRNTK